jgi:hypothetical protein
MSLGKRRMGDTLVKMIRLLVCAGALGSSLLSGSFAAADAVDDLLAGKAVVVAAPDSSAATAKTAALTDDQVLERLMDEQNVPGESQEHTFSQEPLEVTLSDRAAAALPMSQTEDELRLATGAATNMTLVPEPSAIILAVSSLVYFLIFFRRRYAF